MERELVALLDRIVREERYSNRSEALRSLVRRELIREHPATGDNPTSPDQTAVAGVVTLVYPYSHTLSNAPISPYPSLEISANLTLHLAGDVCLKVLVVQGLRGEVHDWAAPVIAQRGITGDLTVVATEEMYGLLDSELNGSARNRTIHGRGRDVDRDAPKATGEPSSDSTSIPASAGNPVTLELTRGGVSLFSSSGRWLYPLMELEQYLRDSGTDPAECLLHDKLVGKAAALLTARLGVRSLVTETLSAPAERVLQHHTINYYTRNRVPRIDCATEALLEEVDDPEIAYALIIDRIASTS